MSLRPGILRAALGGILLAAMARNAAGQTISGRVVDSATAAPIYGAMVELQDSAGRVLREVLTAPSGSFAIAPPVAGVYRYRVAAIGYRPLPAVRLTVTVAGLDLGPIAMARTVMRLPDIVARANLTSCGTAQVAADPVLGRLLGSARNALEVMEANVYSGDLAFAVELVHTSTSTYGNHTAVTGDTMHVPLVGWPIRSLDPDSLRRFGFAADLPNGGQIYYGPDAAVLFADWFVAQHCYTVAVQRDSSGETIAVHFEPEHPRHADIAGDLFLDPESLALRSMAYHLMHLPYSVKDGAVGGTMTFDDRASGLWVPTSWAIWAPARPGFGWQSARNENSGRVVSVKADSSQ